MTQKYLVKVTQENINNGCPNSPGNCPIHHALRTKFKNFSVFMEMIVCYDKRQCAYLLPVKAREFIKKFDNHEKVKPFKFYLTVKE